MNKRFFFICDRFPEPFANEIRESLSTFAATEQETLEATEASIIISQSTEYCRHTSAKSNCENVFIVTACWALCSATMKSLEPPNFYSADPLKIFSGLSINLSSLGNCNLTDFYSSVISFYGGRTTSGCSDWGARNIISVMTKSPGGGSDSNIHDQSYRYGIETRNNIYNVSYTWLDSCILQKKKVPMEGFYMTSDNNISVTLSPFRKKDQEMAFICKELYLKNLPLAPLRGKSVLVSKQLSSVDRKYIKEAVTWMGASLLSESSLDLKSDLEKARVEMNDLVIVTIDRCCSLLKEVVTITRLSESQQQCTAVSTYFISKLLKNQTLAMPQAGLVDNNSLDVKALHNLIYRPSFTEGATCEVKGCIFAISGFDDFSCPTRADIEAALSYGGAINARHMVEGLTSHLICNSNYLYGGKYDAAKRWGPTLIKIVDWKWLLKCLLQYTCSSPIPTPTPSDPEANMKIPFINHIVVERNDGNDFDAGKVTTSGVILEVEDLQNGPTENNCYRASGALSDIAAVSDDVIEMSTTDLIEESGRLSQLSQHDLTEKQGICTHQHAPSTSKAILSKEGFDEDQIYSDDICSISPADHTAEATSNEELVLKSTTSSPPRFLLGGGASEEQLQEAKKAIEHLGGRLVETQFDDSCTHLILWELKRTEKYLCACASGKWVLRPEYLSDSLAAAFHVSEIHRRFLPEVDYEWGIESSSLHTDDQIIWAKACRQWRVIIGQNEENMPFKNMNSIIVGKTIPPSDTLQRMIVSGGGSATVVLDIQEITSPLQKGFKIEDINVVITSSSSSTNERDLTQLSSHFADNGLNVPFLTPKFLLDKISRICVEGGEGENSGAIAPVGASYEEYNALKEKRTAINVSLKKNKKAKIKRQSIDYPDL